MVAGNLSSAFSCPGREQLWYLSHGGVSKHPLWWEHQGFWGSPSFICFGTLGQAADDPCTVGNIFIFHLFFCPRLLGFVSVQLPPSSWMRFFFPPFKIHFGRGAAGLGMGLAQNQQCVPSQRCPAAHQSFISVETQQAP